MSRRSLTALLLAACAALTACQAAGTADDRGGDDRGLNAFASLPFADYTIDEAGARKIHTAGWVLARSCMDGLGFSGFTTLDPASLGDGDPLPQGGPDAVDAPDVGTGDTLYGVDDPDTAATRGYHQPPLARGPRWVRDQYEALTGLVGEGRPRTAHGHRIPEGGCLGQARRTIYGAPPKEYALGGLKMSDYEALTTTLTVQAFSASQKDPVRRKADRAWSRCMAEAGLRYASPYDAASDPHWGTDRPSPREKKTATEDARCKRETGYVRTAHAVDVRFEKRLVAGHRAELEHQRDRDRAAVARAAGIISHG
ncbi:hypothetical protein AB0C59_13240 [Streptomyces sp. NPDC048664]|uniref:hypothetical protein n=1 Tax=Streptomyces sp. NPDC048664 TaxID=3154505 RepID=UPI003444747B